MTSLAKISYIYKVYLFYIRYIQNRSSISCKHEKFFTKIKRNDRIEEQTGLAYAQMLLSVEGQKLIQRAGMIPIINNLPLKVAATDRNSLKSQPLIK